MEAHGVSSPSASEAKTPVGQSDVDSPTVGAGGGPPITSPIFALNDGKRKYVDFGLHRSCLETLMIIYCALTTRAGITD